MSTTTERRESTGIVGETLRRPIQEAVREGVREAMAEREVRYRAPAGERSGEDDGGGGRSRYALFALLGLGVAGFLLWRRRSGGSGGGEERRRTESIREQSKTGHAGGSGPGSTQRASGMTEAAETVREDTETEDAAPGQGNE